MNRQEGYANLTTPLYSPAIDRIAEPLLFDWYATTPEEVNLRAILTQTLREVRELLHRSGRLSSRHEALDEFTKLLFAHVMSIDTGGPGICRAMIARDRGAAYTLRAFVAEAFRQHLPTSLSHELKPDDFELRIKESEDRFALELIECFRHLASQRVVAKIRGEGGIDVLNDTFGQFLSDSFIDEKELGQYLTPIEVVRFMVRLGMSSLDDSDVARFCDPQRCTEGGLILDPSCGTASFLAETLRVLYTLVRERHGERALGSWVKSMMASVIVGVDKSERMIKLALTNLALFGVPAANLYLANALVRTGPDAEITERLTGRGKLILTNPPFGAEFDVCELSAYKIATKWSRRSLKTIDSEILFMERYLEWLAPGGVLVAIVPDSILTNRGLFADLRRGLAPFVELLSVISLPNVTFGVAGTTTKTSILHVRKSPKASAGPNHVYYAICKNIGYEVSSRGAHRRKVFNGTNELADILKEACREVPPNLGRLIDFNTHEPRWDAIYHAGLPPSVHAQLNHGRQNVLRVRDVAFLSTDRLDPKRSRSGDFEYIEISDIDARTCRVRSKTLRCLEAPSRARKRVRAGDVLVSTVRPERRLIGVVPSALDGAVCSTGFAVLRCTAINPLVLAHLLQSDFANTQILRNNAGIAYPAIDEGCLLDIVLPIDRRELVPIEKDAREVTNAQARARDLEEEFDRKVQSVIQRWFEA